MDVAGWLRQLGLEKYGPAFQENAIGGDVLPSLTADDLKELGVAVVGDRRRVLDAIAALREGRIPAEHPATRAASAGDRRSTAPPAAERRQVTVMFCDLVGSTALSGGLDPEDLREVISRYHACVAETVGRFDGFVAKYMGDGVLVYFGYPHAHEDDAEQTVRAALALVNAVGELPLTQPSPDGRGLVLPLPVGEGRGEGPLQVRIGIATGLVVVGDLIGAGSAQEQAIVGETPNLAARLQTLAEPNAVVIAEGTRRQIGARFEVVDLGPQSLKGFSQTQLAWRVLSENRALGRFEALRSGATPLIGRDEELDLLLRRWAQAKAGAGRAVLISAEAGIGKSRLAEALVERIAGEPHMRLRYFCSPHHQDSALYPIIAQMERAADFSRDDAPGEKLGKLQALLGYVKGDPKSKTVIAGRPLPLGEDPVVDPAIQRGPEMAGSRPAMTGTNDVAISSAAPSQEDLALIAELHSLPTSDIAPPLDVTPQRKKEKTFEALLRQVERLSRQQPVLMVFEDIHWIDPSSRELLDRTMQRIANRPVLLLATFRAEFQPPWTGQPHVTMLALARLDRRNTAAMVENIAGNSALPADIVQEIAQRTDGVPLFIEELTKAVLESGAQGTAALSAVPHPALSVPATLHASLMARLDRLGPAAKDVAQKGAAIGREFGHELLASVADLPEPQLREALDRLTNSGLLFARGTPPQSSYTFKHALVQDAAYGTLLRGRRHELHRRIAAALEARFPETAETQPALLAHHFTEAGLAEQAVGYWLKAGQQALSRSAMVEAVAQLRKGLDLLAGLPDSPGRRQQELDLLIALRPALATTKGFSAPDVGEAIARARALAQQIDQPEHLLPLIYSQWASHWVRAEHKLALAIAEQIEEIGEARNDVAAQLLGRCAHGIGCFYIGRFLAARALLERCHDLSDPAHRAAFGRASLDSYVTMLAHLAVTLAYLGYVDQARAQLNEALSEARRLRRADTLAIALLRANWIDLLTCSPDLQRHAEELLALSTEHGFSLWLGWATAFRGSSLAALGQTQQGLALLTQGLMAVRATGTVANTPYLLMGLAEVHSMLGQPVEGLKFLAEAAQIIDATEERVNEAELHRLRGDLLNAIGDRSAAERSYHQAIAAAQRQSAKLFELRASVSLARLWRDQGRRTEARELLAPVYDWFTEGFDAPDLIEAKALLDELAAP